VPPAYDPAKDVALPNGMTASIVSVQYWFGQGGADGRGAFGPACHDDVPTWRLQLITVMVSTPDGKVQRSISVVKRG